MTEEKPGTGETEEQGDNWSLVTLRMPEEWIDLAEKISRGDDIDYNKSKVIRYAMDRKFEHQDEWVPTTSYDPKLEELIDEYGEGRGIIEEGMSQVDEFLDGERGNVSGDIDEFDYIVSLYTLADETGDQRRKNLAEEYLRENFPESEFTRYVLGGDE